MASQLELFVYPIFFGAAVLFIGIALQSILLITLSIMYLVPITSGIILFVASSKAHDGETVYDHVRTGRELYGESLSGSENNTEPEWKVNTHSDTQSEEFSTDEKQYGSRLHYSNNIKYKNARDTLGLDPDFSKQDLHDAYRDQVMNTHPDTESGSKSDFIDLQEAYDYLFRDDE